MKPLITLLTSGVVATFLSACAVGPNYTEPQSQLSEAFHAAQPLGTATTNMPSATEWWSLLNDPILTDLIESAAQSNLDVSIALARLREARAGQAAARGANRPNIGTGGSATTLQQSQNSPLLPPLPAEADIPDLDTDLYQVGFDAAWEIDLFGGNRRATEAATARFEAAEAGLAETQRIILAEVALNYVELRGLQGRRAVIATNIATQEATLEFVESRLEAGLGTELEVSQAKSQLLTTQAILPAIESGIRQRIYQIATLLGEQPGSRAKQLSMHSALPAIPEAMITGIPSEVLRNRPDVRIAERLLAAETADLGVATADLFPKFSLTGQIGGESGDSDSLFNSASETWSIGPGFSWALFQGGQIRANIEAQEAQIEIALGNYEKAVLAVMQEVNSALVQHHFEKRTATSLRSATEESRRNQELAQVLYEEGLRDFLSVLDSQRQLTQVEDQLTQSETREWTSLIRLYKALGGDWIERG